MKPGTTLYATYVVDHLHSRIDNVTLAAGVITGEVSTIITPDGVPLVQVHHGQLEPYRESRWFRSLADAKDVLAKQVERRSADLAKQAEAIRAEAALDRRKANDNALAMLNNTNNTEAA